MKGLKQAYGALSDVYISKCYVGDAIKKQGEILNESKGSLRLIYGVIEHSYLFDYQISLLSEKKPKTAVCVLLKMGMYLIKFMDDMPVFAAVDEICKLAKSVGKGAVVGFINAILRKYGDVKDKLPTDESEKLSVISNRPIWLVKKYESELGKEKAHEILLANGSVKTHVRPSYKFGINSLKQWLDSKKIEYESTPYGVNVGAVGALKQLLNTGKCTVQSQGSIEIANALGAKKGRVLDLCAAPGGKSVYIAERLDGEVTACDLYAHRVELINKYAKRMHVQNIVAELRDGKVFEPKYERAFEYVLLDAPCSGLGTLPSNPDVVLNRQESDLALIIATQKTLLDVASRYVKTEGNLLYSTCSDLPSENGQIVTDFLKNHSEYVLEKEHSTQINENGGEGYYYAILRRK